MCGEVFRARIPAAGPMERPYAFKRFFPLIPSAALASAATAYGAIDHPRVARLFDHGDVDGVRFTAVELVDGASLDRLLAATFGTGRPLPSGAGLGVVARVARAVAYTHGRGVHHLGLAPRTSSPPRTARSRSATLASCRSASPRRAARSSPTRP